MTQPVKIDSHVHIYETSEIGYAEKTGYEVWEYGELPGVRTSALNGTVDELLDSMRIAGISKSVIVNLYTTASIRAAAVSALEAKTGASARDAAMREIDARLADEMRSFNRWACAIGRDHPELAVFVAADPTLLPDEAGAKHVRELHESQGARGVKLHGAAQGFNMSDRRMWATYRTCEELGLPIIAHSGPDRLGEGYAEPPAFVEMLRAFPDLKVVVAHLGGGTWRLTREVAEAFPNAYFDCCEIIDWTGSPKGPSQAELAKLIQDIGPRRVMMGSDFPWYDLDNTVDRVMSLPLLAGEEKERILGANAQEILGL